MISRNDVVHIAELARIEITREEEKKFEKELSVIIQFIDDLNRAPTETVLPVTGGTELKNISRPDEVVSTLEENQAALVGAAPETKSGWIKVRAVFN